jgi:ankyrin repeat protein
MVSDWHVAATPLHVATFYGNTNVVQALLASGADTNSAAYRLNSAGDRYSSDKRNFTPLVFAVDKGNIDIVKELIAAGADINVKNLDNDHLLTAAAKKGYADIVKELVAAGVQEDEKRNALLAASKGSGTEYADVAKAIIASGVDVDAKTLSACVKGGNADFVRELLTGVSDINSISSEQGSRTLLHDAADSGHAEVVRELLAAGANDEAIDNRGRTPLLIAAQNGHVNVVGEILKFNTGEDTSLEEMKFTTLIGMCMREPTRKQVEDMVNRELIYKNRLTDSYKRTKEYSDKIDAAYSEITNKLSDDYSKQERKLACSQTIIEIYNNSEKLPIIYDYCYGTFYAREGKINQVTPEQMLSDSIFLNCIDDFKIYKEDYVTTKDYMIKQLQKDQDAFSSKDAKSIRDERNKRAEAEQKAFIYQISPRGNCERRCNKQYTRNSDLWNSCMNICKNMRSDIPE